MKVEVVRHCAMIPVLRYVTTTGGETLVPSRPEVELTMDDMIGQLARMTGRELANQRASLQAVLSCILLTYSGLFSQPLLVGFG